MDQQKIENHIKVLQDRHDRLDSEVQQLENNLSNTSIIVDLKKRLKADYVFLKVPPLYVGNELVTEVESLANHRLKLIRSRAGEVVIDDNFLFSNSEYFCNSTHSNEKGRRVFTENIKKSIASYLPMKQ